MPSLIGRTGPRAGRRLKFEDTITFGRDLDVGVQLPDDEVSRMHASIRPAGDGFVIEDHGSTNGTFVNEQRVASVVELRSGDLIVIGASCFEIEIVREGRTPAWIVK